MKKIHSRFPLLARVVSTIVLLGPMAVALAHTSGGPQPPTQPTPSEGVDDLIDSMNTMPCEEWWLYWHTFAFHRRPGHRNLLPEGETCHHVRRRFFEMVRQLSGSPTKVLITLEKHRPRMPRVAHMSREINLTDNVVLNHLYGLRNTIGQALVVLAVNPEFTYSLPTNPANQPHLHNVHITSLPISKRTIQSLYPSFHKMFGTDRELNPPTVGHLVSLSAADLLEIRGIGQRMVEEIQTGLGAHGLQLAP